MKANRRDGFAMSLQRVLCLGAGARQHVNHLALGAQRAFAARDGLEFVVELFDARLEVHYLGRRTANGCGIQQRCHLIADSYKSYLIVPFFAAG